jgi:TM2 domain-containing membrane protein YozV
MTNLPLTTTPTPSSISLPFPVLAGILSYLVPGLGQIVQGRVAKGLLFLVCIYSLFFYGVYLGTASVQLGERTYRINSNVYLPDIDEARGNIPQTDGLRSIRVLLSSLYNRPQFAGQFWVGIAAWPAIIQYRTYDAERVQAAERELDGLYAELAAMKDNPEESARLRSRISEIEQSPVLRNPLLGDFMREPSASATNAVHNAADKRLELAWVYTVIAGVLNIMVIYDAIAGPAFVLALAPPAPTLQPERKS